MANLNVNNKVAAFIWTVLNILKYYIPLEAIIVNDNDPRWFNKRIKSLIHKVKGCFANIETMPM